MTCVLDASVALSFVLTDEFGPESARILDLVVAHGARVPVMWELEVLKGLRSAERRGRFTEAGVLHAVRGLTGLPIERDRRSLDNSALLSLSKQFSLNTYDASYLLLAMDIDVPLATNDTTLRVSALGRRRIGLTRTPSAGAFAPCTPRHGRTPEWLPEAGTDSSRSPDRSRPRFP
ncbi:MAG: type II toxin-antitoxin system VapC family toxin [Candidatus Nanopelagicales bacterium]